MSPIEAPRLSQTQLAELQAAHDWHTVRPLPDGRLLGKGKPGLTLDPRFGFLRARLGEGLRVLELGSHEGQHTVRLAELSREVVAVEVRARSVVGALIRQLAHGARNVTNVIGDVRDVDLRTLNRFDLLFHVGLLYHLADPVEHLLSLAGVADSLFLDTHYATDEQAAMPEEWLEHAGRRYRSRRYREHGWGDSFSGTEEVSRWLYREDLLALVRAAGFVDIEVQRDEQERHGPRIGLLARTPQSSRTGTGGLSAGFSVPLPR